MIETARVQKILESMAEEFDRQAQDDGPTPYFSMYSFEDAICDGHFNLTLVAEAIHLALGGK